MAGFRNTLYKDEWDKYVGTSTHEFADGTFFKEGDKFAVYDGGQNLMGYIDKNGVFSAVSPLTEYMASFLRSAKEELIKERLIVPMSGDGV